MLPRQKPPDQLPNRSAFLTTATQSYDRLQSEGLTLLWVLALYVCVQRRTI